MNFVFNQRTVLLLVRWYFFVNSDESGLSSSGTGEDNQKHCASIPFKLIP